MGRILTALALPLLLCGCAAESRYRIASFLFDGVPPPAGSQEVKPSESQPVGEDRQPKSEPEPEPVPVPTAGGSIHEPFRSRSCRSCHDPAASNRLVREGNDLCFTCHRQIIAGKRVSHVPALADCLICHRPHNSENLVLLQQPLPDICLMCHDEGKMIEVHGEIGECLACHNPHESDEDRLLEFE
jgi:predicted CXXCH cytochrome family protein